MQRRSVVVGEAHECDRGGDSREQLRHQVTQSVGHEIIPSRASSRLTVGSNAPLVMAAITTAPAITLKAIGHAW